MLDQRKDYPTDDLINSDVVMFLVVVFVCDPVNSVSVVL